jgi:putative glutamine amidotransferase
MSLPRIGLTTSWTADAQTVRHAYVCALVRAGACPLLVPMTDDDAVVDALADTLDALVVVGGPAVTAGLTGPLAPDLDACPPARDAADRALLAAMLRRDRPVLGICYGMQLLSALAGGTTYGDVERERPGTQPHSQKRDAPPHGLHLAPGSLVHDALADAVARGMQVNTRHLQAVASPGDGYRVTANAPDGVIEAIEHADGRRLGVQFHPERLGADGQPLFDAFVARVRALRPLRANA